MPEEEESFGGFDKDEDTTAEIKKMPRNQSVLSMQTMKEQAAVQGGRGGSGKSNFNLP